MIKVDVYKPNSKELLENWDTGFVNLNRNNGMFTAENIRLRNCALYYNESCNEYYVKHGGITYGLHDIYNLRYEE